MLGRMSGWLRIVLVAAVALVVSCARDAAEKLAPSTITSAELRMIRRGVTVVPAGEAEREPYARERLGAAAEVRIAAGGLAWLRRDGGTTLLVSGPGKVSVLPDGQLRVDSGKVFGETPAGATETIQVPAGPLVLSAVRTSLDIAADKTVAYVLEGAIRSGDHVAGAGETLTLAEGKAEVAAALSWDDWTGGLATTDPESEPAPFGVGTVGARVPGSAGTPHVALTIQRLDVRVRIDGDLAVTEVDQTFFNPESTTVEGVYRFRTPDGALLERFGVDRDGGILYGFVKEKRQAEKQYQAHVYQGSTEDPALLAWQGPGSYEARLFPIAAGATRRVVVRYTEWLARAGAKGERRLYVYPMAFEGAESSAPQIEDLSIEVDLAKANAKLVRAAAGTVRVGDTIIVRGHDLVPRADFALELQDDGLEPGKAFRAKHVPDAVALGPEEANDARRKGDGEADYLLVPVRPTDVPKREEGLDLCIVVDTSAATDKPMLRLARSMTRALLAHLGDKDRVLVLRGDDRLRPIGGSGELAGVDQAGKAEILAGLSAIAPSGASDLAAMLAEATTKVGDARATAIVYIGDGLSTVGETDLASIRERLQKAPRLVRTFGIGIGDAANLAMLSGLSVGGFADRVSDDRSAARAALRLLETAERSVDLGATLDLGSAVERVYPRELGAIVAGETIMVVGRVAGDAPKQATLATTRGSATLELDVSDIEDHGHLRRSWAMGRLDELISSAAGHAALVDLGVRQGIITPVTSIYVPTSKEMTREQRASIDRRVRERTPAIRSPKEEEEEQDGAEKAGGAGRRRDDAKLRGASRALDADELAEGDPDDDAEPAAPRAKAEATAMASAAAQNAPPGAKEPPIVSPSESPSDSGGEARGGSPSPQATRPESPPQDGPNGFADPAMPEAAEPRRDQAKGTYRGAGGDAPAEPSAEGEDKKAQEKGHAAAYGEGDGTIIIVIDDPGRLVRKCGPGADLPFEQRKNLWRERLSSTNAQPGQVLSVYQKALAWCEAPTKRERSALLLLGLDYLPAVATQVGFYRLLSHDAAAADVVYRGILGRVTTPAQVRELNAALGLTTADPQTIETAIAKAKDPLEVVVALRGFAAKFPDDLTLGLRLLDALEDAGDWAGARLLASELRQRRDADTRVRTAVGELHLRLARRANAAVQKQADEEEAKRAFGEIVEFSPEDPVARRRLGDLYRAHGYFAEAARQYETLVRLIPDDPTAVVLLAASANGLGKLEEAVRWTEKGAAAGAPDVAQGPHATARAFAALFIAWGRLEAKAAGRTEEWKALGARLDKVAGGERRAGEVRVLLSWSHPELHPTLWTNALGTMMPAAEGDVTLGLAQGMVADKSGTLVEVRVEPSELDHAARLEATAVLTVIFGEGADAEVIDKREIRFTRGEPVQRFSVAGNRVAAEVAK